MLWVKSLYAGGMGCCSCLAAFGTWIGRLAAGARKEFHTYALRGTQNVSATEKYVVLCFA